MKTVIMNALSFKEASEQAWKIRGSICRIGGVWYVRGAK